MDLRLSGLFVWRRVVELGYCPLESFLSVEPMIDEALICVDPDGPETMRLVDALAAKFPDKVRVIEFSWPIGLVEGNGAAIGVASNYALQHCRTQYAFNIQADETYPSPLMNWLKENWREAANQGYECLTLKVLHTEHNAQQFQGGDSWDGRKNTPEWSWQKGAGYNKAVKWFKVCPKIRFSHDGWSMDNCGLMGHVNFSDQYPVMHLHDFFRDSYIAMRRNAADALWTDLERHGNYKASADTVEATKDEWYGEEKWTRTESPFSGLLPDFVKPLIGQPHYEVRYDLLENW